MNGEDTALDVERLKVAIHRAVCDRPPGFSKHEAGNGSRCQLSMPDDIAIEYATLTAKEAPADPEPIANETVSGYARRRELVNTAKLIVDDNLRAVVDAAVRLAKVLDLASSAHTPERRAARLALYDALRKAGLWP